MNRHSLDNDRFFDEKIQAVATIQLDLPIDHGQGFLGRGRVRESDGVGAVLTRVVAGLLKAHSPLR